MLTKYNASFVKLISFLSYRFKIQFSEADIDEVFEASRGDMVAAKPTVSDILPKRVGYIEPYHMRKVILFLAGHKKIEAIREFRNATGAGLKEAKDCVEAIAEEINAIQAQLLNELNSLVKINPRFNQQQRDTFLQLTRDIR